MPNGGLWALRYGQKTLSEAVWPDQGDSVQGDDLANVKCMVYVYGMGQPNSMSCLTCFVACFASQTQATWDKLEEYYCLLEMPECRLGLHILLPCQKSGWAAIGRAMNLHCQPSVTWEAAISAVPELAGTQHAALQWCVLGR
eukprot:1160381-Pelagomonas_calceolata.AAC.3